MKRHVINALRWSEKYTKTDMVYLASGNFWLTVSRVVSIITGIILTTALANLLSPAVYGYLDYMIAAASIIGAFTITGLSSSILNRTARGDDGTLRESTRKGIKWFIPSAIIAALVGCYYLWRSDMQMAIGFMVIALCAPFGILGNYKSYLQGKGDFRTQTLYGIVRTVVPIALLITVAATTKNPITIVATYFISGALTSTVIYILTIKKYQIPHTSTDYRAAMSFAKHTSVVGFLLQLSAQIDQFFVWHFMGAEAVATYSIATSPVEELKNVPANILAVAAPRLATKKDSDMRAMVSKKIRQILLIVTPITLIYIVAAPVLFTTLFPRYVGAIIYTQFYALTLLLQPQNLIDSALLAKDDIKTRRRVVITGQVLKLTFLGTGIWLFGIWGGISALILSDLTNSVLLLFAIKKLA